MNRAIKEKAKMIREQKIPSFARSQSIIAAVPDLREAHEAYVRGTLNDLNNLNIHSEVLGSS